MSPRSRSFLDGHPAAPDLPDSSRTVTALGCFLLAMAAVVLLGWATESQRLVSVTLGRESMKPQTAVCVALLGLGIALIGVRPMRPGRIELGCGLGAAAIGAVVCGEYLLSLSTGFDTLLFEAQVRAPGGLEPGRMAQISAVCMLVSGAALAARVTGHTFASHIGGLVTATVGTVVLTSFLYDAQSLRRVGDHAGVALHTGIAIAAVGVALVLATPQHGLAALARHGGGSRLLVRGGLPLVVAAPIVVGWLSRSGERAGWYDDEFGVALIAASCAAVGAGVVWVTAIAVARYEASRERARAELARLNAGLEDEIAARTAALHATEAIQRASLDSLEQGVVLFDDELEVLLLNAAGVRILGYDRAELTELARSGQWVTFREDGSVLPFEERPIVQTMTMREPVSGALIRWRTKTGSSVLLRVSTRPIFEDDGRLSRMVLAFADVTAERAAERSRGRHMAELATLNEALEEAVALKDQILATASHDLRNPIAAILGFADLLTRPPGDLPEGLREEAVEAITRQGQRLKALVDDLLIVGVLETEGFDLAFTPVDLSTVLPEIAHDAAIASEVRLEVPSGLVAQVDAQRLAQMVTNLLTNADRYGAPPVTLSAEATDSDVVIRVTDCGPGVPDHFVGRLFDKFATAKASDNRAQRSTGLGLAIVRGLAEAHGGSVGYEPIEGGGASFTLRLPLTAPVPAAPAQPDEDIVDPSVRRVLVVDDDPDVLDMLRAQLDRAGFSAICAGDGEQALALARTRSPDLVLADLDLPGTDGFSLIEKLTSDPKTSHLPIVVLTGHTTGALAAQALSAGAYDFLRKPVEPIELIARLRATLTASGRTADLARLADSLDEASRSDALTSLLNRRGLEAEIERLTGFARKHNLPVSVLVTDIDHFKSINDAYGHDVGDGVLRTVADAINLRTRGGDVVGRWGGEEFLSLLPGTDPAGAVNAAERLRAAVASVEVAAPSGDAIRPTVSVGVATATDGDIVGAVTLADRRLYEAKAAGRNRVKGPDAVS